MCIFHASFLIQSKVYCMKRLPLPSFTVICTAFFILIFCSAAAQFFTEIIGRPTDSSISINFLADQNTDVYWEYGFSSGAYPFSTGNFVAVKDTTLEADFTDLMPDHKYYYRTRYRVNGSSASFTNGPEHTFHTARIPGTTFIFAIEADPHLDTNSIPAAYSLTLQNILVKNPDFLLDLGDIFMSEKFPPVTQQTITARHLLYRSYYGSVCHSVPLFIVIGNHEGENGWVLNGTADCLPVMAANTRKMYYPNPFPDGFYSGDTIAENFVGLRQNYYAWEWGNSLFIVLDPYWYTITKPEWGWTLGEDQYNWFKNVITTSHAKFKFIFCHQLVGGDGNDGRGGTEYSGFFEMGGKNVDSSWGFDTHRPGWGKTIHELMVESNATIFFHGHDHCYAKQDMDGIVYQEVPQPSSRNITNITGTQYGYVNGVLMPSRGYLLVTITDSSAKVDYIRTFLPNEESASHTNGEIAYSYTIASHPSAIEEKKDESSSFQLSQNCPNPFNQETSINYKILQAEKVQIKVYDLFGREISTLVDQYLQPGNYAVPLSSEKSSLRGGIYCYRITCGNYSKSMKMICIK